MFVLNTQGLAAVGPRALKMRFFGLAGRFVLMFIKAGKFFLGGKVARVGFGILEWAVLCGSGRNSFQGRARSDLSGSAASELGRKCKCPDEELSVISMAMAEGTELPLAPAPSPGTSPAWEQAL